MFRYNSVIVGFVIARCHCTMILCRRVSLRERSMSNVKCLFIVVMHLATPS